MITRKFSTTSYVCENVYTFACIYIKIIIWLAWTKIKALMVIIINLNTLEWFYTHLHKLKTFLESKGLTLIRKISNNIKKK